jgi:hypothetical protein
MAALLHRQPRQKKCRSRQEAWRLSPAQPHLVFRSVQSAR